MSKTSYTDPELIDMICHPEKGRDAALKYAYLSWRKDAMNILKSMGTSTNDTEDAVQEAIVVFDKGIRLGNFRGGSSLKTYFISICKGRVSSNRRSVKRINWTDDHLTMDSVEEVQPEIIMLSDEKISIIRQMVGLLDKTCQEVIKLYKLNYANQEIAELLDLNNANNARQWVHKCKNRLKKIIAQHPTYSDYFK
ncbi:MAG: RNA polymerase sigma factor [Saprospiraceae bacterium]